MSADWWTDPPCPAWCAGDHHRDDHPTGLLRPKEHTRRIDFPRATKVLVDEGPIPAGRVAIPLRRIRIDGAPSGHVFGITALDGWEPALRFAQGLTERGLTQDNNDSGGPG